MSDRLSRATTITLDVGGTLIHPYPSVGEVYSKILDRHGIRSDPDLISARFRANFRRVRLLVRDYVDDEVERQFWENLVRDVLGFLCPADTFPQVFEDLYAAFALVEHWKPADGAFETIGTLKRRGYRLAILSNADTRLHKILDELGLSAIIPDVFISADLGFEKPDLRIFRHVETTLKTVPEEMLHVGDSPFHDGEGASGAGWLCLILDRHLDAQKGTISRLADLTDVLGRRA